MTRILVTGASGFIGGHLTSHLEVGCFNFTTFNERLTNDYQLADYGKLDVIVHLAGLAHNKTSAEHEIFNVNFQSTIKLANKSKDLGVGKFIFLSSIAVYGISEGISINEQTLPLPKTTFAISKYQAELGLKALESPEFQVVIIRSPLVYGRGAPANFDLLLKLVSKLPFLPFGLVNNRRSYVAVSNLIDFITHCIIHPNAGGETFLISDGIHVSTKDFTSAISKGINKKALQLPIPLWLMQLTTKSIGKPEITKQLFGTLELDCSKNKRLLGWSPPFTMAQAMKSLR